MHMYASAGRRTELEARRRGRGPRAAVAGRRPRAWSVAILAVLLGACSGAGSPNPVDEVVAWSAERPRRFAIARPAFHDSDAARVWIVVTKRGDSMASRAGGGALTGAAVVTTLGGGCRGYSCIVPLLVLPVAIVGGAIGGAVSGAVDPDTEAHPYNLAAMEAAGVTALGFLNDRKAYESMRDGFIGQARRLGGHDFAVQDAGEVVESVGGDTAIMSWSELRVGFVADAADDTTFALSVSGSLAVKTQRPGEPPREAIFPFAYLSDEHGFADWSEAGGEAIDGEIVKAADHIGHRLASALFAQATADSSP
jgi:hypothetical protein